MRLSATLALTLSLAAGPLLAQSAGDVAVTGFDSSNFSVLDGTSGAATLYSNPGGTFAPAGTSPNTSQSVEWTSNAPGGVYVGGFGFVGRATFTSSGAITYDFIASVGTAAAMGAGASGGLWVADATSDSVALVDPVSGNVETVVASGPWGTSMNALAVDRLNGDVYVGGNNGIWRIPGGDGTPVSFASGWAAGAGFVGGLAVDPASGDLFAGLLSVNRVVRIDATGTLTDLIPAGTLVAPNCVSLDQNFDLVAGGRSQQVLRIPIISGGTFSTIGTGAASGGSASGVSVINKIEVNGTATWQVNQSEAVLFTDGAVASAYRGANASLPGSGSSVNVTFDTSIANTPWDIALSFAPTVPNAATLASGDIVNIDLASSFNFLNGGFAQPGGLTSTTLPYVGITGITASAQLAVINPAAAGGVSASAATSITTM